MSFIRHANTELLAVMDGASPGKFQRIASHSKCASAYVNSIDKVPIAEMLSKVAAEYDISSNPRDYIFEAVRALTADVFNENGDGFEKSELLRFDHTLGRPVYRSFELVPHHINHSADNPKAARGVVLAATYNDLTPPMGDCPGCGAKTAERHARDAGGNKCRKCGAVCKDEFVEILIGIDKRKDPLFAEGVRTGALRATSMGCEAGSTRCNVCENIAHSKEQFCSHIKHGKKKKFRNTAGKEVYAGEWCLDVRFTEDSRVDQPADPSALQREVFEVSASTKQAGHKVSAEDLRAETEALLRKAKLRELANRGFGVAAQMQPSVSPTGDDQPRLDDADKQLSGDKGRDELLEEVEQELNSIQDTHPNLVMKVLELVKGDDGIAPEVAQEAYRQGNNPMGSPASMGVEREEFQGDSVKNVAAGLEESMSAKTAAPTSNARPTVNVNKRASMLPFSSTYSDLQAIPLKSGLVRVASKNHGGTIFTAVAPTGQDVQGFARDVMMHIAKQGLAATVTKYDGALAPRSASILEHYYAPQEKAGPERGGTNKPLTEGHEEPVSGYTFGDPSDDIMAGADFDHDKTPTGKGEGKISDDAKFTHKPGPGAAPTSIVDSKSPSFNVNYDKPPDNALGKQVRDFKAQLKDPSLPKPDSTIPGGDLADPLSTTQLAPDSIGDTFDDPAVEPLGPEGGTGEIIGSDAGTSFEVEVMLDGVPTQVAIEGNSTTDEETGEKVFEVTKATADGADVMEKIQDDPDAVQKIQEAADKANADGIPGEEGGLPDTTPEEEPSGGDDSPPVGDTGEDGGNPFADKTANAANFGDKKAPPFGAKEGDSEKCANCPDGKCACGDKCASGDKGKKFASRLEKFYQNKIAALKKEHQAELEKVKSAGIDELATKWGSALALAADRQALNLSPCCLKEAMCDVLTSEFDINASEAYPGMDTDLAVTIVEQSSQRGFRPFIASLVKDAREFMAMPTEAVEAMRKDAAKLQPVMPDIEPTTRTASIGKTAAVELRQAAVEGNPIAAPAPVSEAPVTGMGKRANIRQALANPQFAWVNTLKQRDEE